nr:Hpt domain-containing protein [Verrucomicrobiota bacterium]
MSTDPPEDLANLSMRELFRVEAENQVAILTRGLLELEQKPATSEHLAELMRAAHSLKGAARIVGLEAAVQIAHALEDCFVLAQRGKLVLRQPEVDLLLRGTDELLQLARQAETPGAGGESAPAAETQTLLRALADLAQAGDAA